MQNYFLLLGLSISPVEENIEVIDKAILQLQIKAQHDMQNPQKELLSQEIIAEIPKIKKVMHDVSLRKKEASAAVQAKGKILHDLDDYVKVISLKGYITSAEKQSLVKKFLERNLTEADISSSIHVPVEDRKNIFEIEANPGKVDSLFLRQINSCMQSLNRDDLSLYSFYNIPENLSYESIVKAAEASLVKIIQKGTKTNYDAVEQKISGSVKVYFKSCQAKERYNFYLKGHRYQKLNALISDGISSTGSFSGSLYQVLCQTAKTDYSMTVEQIGVYIVHYLEYEEIPYSRKDFLREVSIKETDINEKPLSKEPRKKPTSSFSREQIQQLQQQREILQQKKKQFEPINQTIDHCEKISEECLKNITQYKSLRIKKLAYPTKREKLFLSIYFGFCVAVSFIANIYFMAKTQTSAKTTILWALFLGAVGIAGYYIWRFLQDEKIWLGMCKKADIVNKLSKSNLKVYKEDFLPFKTSGKSINPSAATLNHWIDVCNNFEIRTRKMVKIFNGYVSVSKNFSGGISKDKEFSLKIFGGSIAIVIAILIIGFMG